MEESHELQTGSIFVSQSAQAAATEFIVHGPGGWVPRMETPTELGSSEGWFLVDGPSDVFSQAGGKQLPRAHL